MMQRGVPLSWWITGIVLMLIGVTTAAVGGAGFDAARRSVDALWLQLADNLAERTTGQALRFVDGAEPLADLSEELFEDGALDPDRPEHLLAYLAHALDAHPEATWISWGDPHGRFFGVYRQHLDDTTRVRRTLREIVDGGTHYRVEERTPDGWLLVEDHVGERFYDPRERPWYQQVEARDSGDGAWIDPYLFSLAQQAGVTYATPVRTRRGELIGVFSVDYEMAPLSAYLSTLEVGQTGKVYIVTGEGQVVGAPDGQVVRHDGHAPGFWPAAEHPDPMLAAAWRRWVELERPDEPFEVGPWLAMARPFPASSGIPWVVVTAVPSDDLLGPVRDQAVQSMGIAAGALAFALLLGVLLSRVVAGGVAQLRAELAGIARFELSERGDASRSAIREVNEMGDATEVMKQGLRAFARYVPHQLVRHLLADGTEARLGAERRELSVLFSDIAGFTTVVEGNPPEVVLGALGAYLDGMNEAITETGGTVCQYLGDGIMAFWGAPDRLGDHAVRVCEGALRMQAHSRRLVARAERDGSPRLPTRIGIDSGEVMVGNIGAHDRFNYGILGDTVNATARMESLNKVYGTEIVAGARTVELVGAQMVFRALDTVLLKGKHTPSTVYELLGRRGEVPEALRACAASYDAGLAHYRAGRFDEARAAFGEAGSHRDGDPPSALMIARCERLARDTPPGWDGVTVLTEK